MRVRVKERSWLACIAAKLLKQKKIAIVTGNIIHLCNAGKEEFLNNKKWLQHEIVHVLQYKEHGFLKFVFLYLLESLKKGYYNNRFEKEARKYENESSLLKLVTVI